jgi:hypothetical protein
MADIQYFNQFTEKFADTYNIFFIYILQAHSNDWRVGKFSHVDQPKTLIERQKAALKFIDDFKLTLPIYLDNMENSFNTAFGSWPHKSYIIDETAKLIYIEEIKAIDHKTVTTKLIEFLSNA